MSKVTKKLRDQCLDAVSTVTMECYEDSLA